MLLCGAHLLNLSYDMDDPKIRLCTCRQLVKDINGSCIRKCH